MARMLVEQCQVVDVRPLVRGPMSGELAYRSPLGEASVTRYRVDLHPPRLVLTFGPKGREQRQAIPMASVPCYFGGDRWFLLCPDCSRQVAIVYLAPGEDAHRCRSCSGLAYKVTRQSSTARLYRRRARLLARLGLPPSWPWGLPRPRPLGMRGAAYVRTVATLARVEDAIAATWAKEQAREGVTAAESDPSPVMVAAMAA